MTRLSQLAGDQPEHPADDYRQQAAAPATPTIVSGLPRFPALEEPHYDDGDDKKLEHGTVAATAGSLMRDT
jgi:hypothetical protein